MRRRELLWACASLISASALGCRGARDQDDEARSGSPADAERPADALAPADPLGSLDAIPTTLRPAFAVEGHAPAPAELDRSEPAQSWAEFIAEAPARPRPGQETLAILPIGEYPRGWLVEYDRVHLVRSPSPTLLAEFCEAWFGLPTWVLPALSDARLESMPARERDGRRQLDAEALLAWLARERPADAFSVLALTLDDLYQPGAAWVFGLASIGARVGVHSMLRYDPGFLDADARPPEFERIILARALRVVVHETAHMLGLRHCLHYACIMNPTAGLADLDAAPLRSCPVCLRKLWTATGVDLRARWGRLAELTAAAGLDAEARWFAQREASLGS